MRPERTGVGQDKKIRANRSRQKIHGGAGVRFGPDLAPCAWTVVVQSEALWARIPEIQVRIPSRAMGTFFPHTVSSIFRLSLTHTHTHACACMQYFFFSADKSHQKKVSSWCKSLKRFLLPFTQVI